MKKMLSFVMPVIIALVITVVTDNFLQKKIEILCQSKNLSKLSTKYGDSIKDKGIIAKEILSKNGDLFLFGSSEMSIDVPQNALKLFPMKGAEYNVSCFGRGYVQNLQQTASMGSFSDIENQKVAYILSLQWFDNDSGVPADKFTANFSEMQFYKFMDNPQISEENKKYYANRVSKLLQKSNDFKAEEFYCRLYLNDDLISKIEKIIMTPYYSVDKYLTYIKDKALLYGELKKLPDKQNEENNNELEKIDWEDEKNRLSDESESFESNNQFMLKDKFYDYNVKNHLTENKDRLVNQDMTQSVEMQDFKFFLSVCNDLNIKPYIIMPPVNGWYYDYLGLSIEKRNAYYDYISNLCKENQIEVLDLREYEYKKGFLCDVMHLGKEGWFEVSEGIYKHFNEQ